MLISLKSNSEEDTIHLSNEVFKNVKRLRIFIHPNHEKIMHFFSHDPINFLPKTIIARQFEPPKLMGLVMRCSYVVNLWKGSKTFRVSKFGEANPKSLYSTARVYPSVGALKMLTILDVEGCEKLERLPVKLYSGSLEILNYSGCRSLRRILEIQQIMNCLPEKQLGVLEHCKALSFLDLRECIHIETLPSSIRRLKILNVIYLNRCSKLNKLPENIGDLENLLALDASETTIWDFPNSITGLRKLKWLSFRKVPKFFRVSELCWGCSAHSDVNFQLPSDFSVFCQLRMLDFSACNLFDGSIPEDLGCLVSLSELNMSRNYFTYLPKSIAQA